MSAIIKVGFLLSYDYEFLKNSIPCVYEYADSIILAVDQNCRTWSGNPFTIDPSFFEWLEKLDADQKITIYRDDFYIPELSVMENDTRQRSCLAKFMGPGGWHIQIDADEYFVNFPEFVKFLRSKDRYLTNPQETPITVIANWIVLYKKTSRGFLYVKHDRDPVHIATNYPQYEVARNSSQPRLYTTFLLFHQTWARSEKEVYLKLKNWSHKEDFDTESYFRLWQSINEENYGQIQNVHPVNPSMWKELDYAEGENVKDFICTYLQQNNPSISEWRIWIKNHPIIEKPYCRMIRLWNKFLSVRKLTGIQMSKIGGNINQSTN